MLFASGDGRAGGLCLCWNDFNINMNVLAHNSRFIDCEATDKQNNVNFFFTFAHVYPQKNLQP